jgi:NAD(P)-dependent dehydrogenase (short-subunit alcohol dehydrogenase family)
LYDHLDKIIPIKMSKILIIGATRGLGSSIAKQYAAKSGNVVYCTTRSCSGPQSSESPSIKWVPNIDVADPGIGKSLVSKLKDLDASEAKPFDIVVSIPACIGMGL